jgi:putative ABC transport system permease protein
MIVIITYISVLERTKEIGILRSIGASKKDVSRVFNAETGIIGLTSGFLGVGISLLLCIPISAIVHALSGVYDLNAFIRPEHCVVLVLISFILTLISGVIPARIASKKDPVEALRSE